MRLFELNTNPQPGGGQCVLCGGSVREVTIDYEAAADAFNGEMIRITGQSSAVEMRAIHCAVDAAVGEETP